MAVPPGAGKSHLASAIGLALVENGYRVFFTRTTDLVQRLQVARRELALESQLARLDRYHLLILDDLAYAQKDHDTRPRDIERALAGAELDEETRPLALEARAHVIVQRRIDEMHRAGKLPPPTSIEFLTWVHRAFYEEMPEELRFVEHPNGMCEKIVPGHMREEGDTEVEIGRHHPPSSARVSACMVHFDRRFRIAERSASGRIISIASAHHRLNYIHPFPDGNGRVSRLMSHAMALKAGIGGQGLWSVSRGLARGLKDRDEYKQMMDQADSPRRGDRDGRGNLSEAALKDFPAYP